MISVFMANYKLKVGNYYSGLVEITQQFIHVMLPLAIGVNFFSPVCMASVLMAWSLQIMI